MSPMPPLPDSLGLDAAEQAVYAMLVETPPATASDLQVVVSGAQLTDALGALESKGLITRLAGVPPRYSAIDPEIALEALIIEREDQLRRARLTAQSLAAKFRARADRRDPTELIEIVTGSDAVAKRVQQIQGLATQEFRFIDRPPYLLHADALSDTEVSQLDRDVRYRGIYDPAGFKTEAHKLNGDMQLTLGHGEEARVLPDPPVKLLLIDDRYACLPLQAAPHNIASIAIVHPSGLLEALSALFEALWQQAIPLTLSATEATPTDAPSDDDRLLLAMLTAGVSDHAAAKQLGISPRTHQRRVRDLMHRLGSETRFQAGLQANRRGWV